MTGKLIIIDGTDGSGKTTQAEILIQKLKTEGYEVETADFPQYNTKSSGLVENYLEGKYGEVDDVDAKVASIFYAADRYDASFKIRKWIDDGKIVISNRYVSANMGHQGTKIENEIERKKLFDWLYELEYDIFKIPKPDLNIILHVPASVSQKLAQKREREDWKGKKKDIHQENLAHLKLAEKAYLDMVDTHDNFELIECVNDQKMLSREDISKMIWNKVEKNIE